MMAARGDTPYNGLYGGRGGGGADLLTYSLSSLLRPPAKILLWNPTHNLKRSFAVSAPSIAVESSTPICQRFLHQLTLLNALTQKAFLLECSLQMLILYCFIIPRFAIFLACMKSPDLRTEIK